jgi:hypothetical protein
MHIIAIERCGWEVGEEILGLKLEEDNNLGTMEFVLLCDANRPPLSEEEVEQKHQQLIDEVIHEPALD